MSSDARHAGAEAARTAMAGSGEDAGIAIVFCSVAYDLQSLLSSIRGELPSGVPLVGCSTAGEIATTGPSEAGVVVTLLGGTGFDIHPRVVRGASKDLFGAGVTVALAADEADAASHPHQVLMLLTDGLAGDQEEIVRGAFSVVGSSVPLVGGSAGDDLQMTKTFQLVDDEVLSDVVIGVSIASDAPFGIGVKHGWRPIGDGFVVTRSSATRVFELDDRPALDAYLDHVGAPEDVRTDPEAFGAFALTHPFGVSRGPRTEVRFIADANWEDRSIGCIANVPEGGVAWIMEGDSRSVLEATSAAYDDAIAGFDGRAPIGVLCFDCIARRVILGDDGGTRSEVEVVRSRSRAAVAGFYTYGEIARVSGTKGFHNQTMVLLAVA